ncbi:MAG: hypothetical protein K0S42_2684 [Microvirga sp.]|jgi:hypothetical protein|nr:hypothetical protein [Microvirga sp.]
MTNVVELYRCCGNSCRALLEAEIPCGQRFSLGVDEKDEVSLARARKLWIALKARDATLRYWRLDSAERLKVSF